MGFFDSLLSGLAGPVGQSAWEWGQKRPTAPQMPQNPYQGNYGTLISQLEAQGRGEGPSLAGEAYKQAHQQALYDAQAMGRGGSAGAARMGARQMGMANQGLAQGYSNARLQEQLAARQMLTQALGGASQSWFQPNAANLQAQMNTPSNMQQLMSFLSQLSGSAAQLSSKAGTGGMA